MSDIRMITLLPDQVSRDWPVYRRAIEASLPTLNKVEDPDRMANVLERILAGELKVHLFCILSGDVPDIHAIVVTGIIGHFESHHKDMLIFALSGNGAGTPSEWKDGWELLKLYAKGEKCRRLIMYSDQPTVVRFVRTMGGSSYTTLAVDL